MENFIYLGLNIRVKNIILFISFNKFLYDLLNKFVNKESFLKKN